MKRTADILLAGAGLALLWPVLLLAAIAIRLDSRGPALFRQERVGRFLRPFRIYKFRTMAIGSDRRGPGITARGDRRVTRVGAFLRATKLDELPQLLNVLRGDMSLVGPRPELPRYVQRYRDDFREILQVRPGITDLASILYRHEAQLLAEGGDAEEHYLREILPHKIRLGREYVSNASLLYDLWLILKTLFVLLYPARLVDRVGDALGRHHTTATTLVQAALAAAANLGALALRFDGAPPAEVLALALRTLPVLVVVRAVWLRIFQLDRDMWQYVSLRELTRVMAAVAAGTATFALLLHWPLIADGYPASVLLLDAVLSAASLGGARVLRRMHRGLASEIRTSRRILVVGADHTAERVVRELLDEPGHDHHVVGLLGVEPAANGLRIHDVPILGGLEDLGNAVREQAPDEIVVVAKAIPVAQRGEVLRACRASGRAVKVVPDLGDLLAGRDAAHGVPAPETDGLLFREPVQVDLELIQGWIRGRRVLVTGAGGSIGSEICRQVTLAQPERLVLFEQHEGSLYDIERELRGTQPNVALEAVIGDVRDPERVAEAFAASRPQIVFHAAAYKHVPMMEHNPWEAVKTNVLGTRELGLAADRFGVETFVLISTDKAVEPVCAMGTTKRIAELVLQGLAAGSRTQFMAVRFGNVLGSSGSVVPLFREQIERGGPVTVTHPDVTRWFMTVPEAVQLILESARRGKGGEVFVLDMGKPVRVLDLAEALIRQYGHQPGTEIPIVFTGLRPGERLFEKLFNDREEVWKTPHPRVLMAVDPHRNGTAAARRTLEIRGLLQALREMAGARPMPAAVQEIYEEVGGACVAAAS